MIHITVKDIPALVVGFLHGYVVWNFIFRATQPIVRLITPEHGKKLRASDAISHLVVFLLLLMSAFLLLQGLGLFISAEVSRQLKGRLFFGSFIGWICSGAIPRIEAKLRKREPRDHRT